MELQTLWNERSTDKEKQIVIMKEYNFKINGNSYKVAVNNIDNGVATVSVNGTDYKVEM